MEVLVEFEVGSYFEGPAGLSGALNLEISVVVLAAVRIEIALRVVPGLVRLSGSCALGVHQEPIQKGVQFLSLRVKYVKWHVPTPS